MNNSETCGDCGTLLQGNFCHNCGPLGPFFELFYKIIEYTLPLPTKFP